jgi:hypothetical protein
MRRGPIIAFLKFPLRPGATRNYLTAGYKQKDTCRFIFYLSKKNRHTDTETSWKSRNAKRA